MSAAASWWLHSSSHTVSWGPFDSEALAWRFLFGQPVDQVKQDEGREAGWVVDQVKPHPCAREAA